MAINIDDPYTEDNAYVPPVDATRVWKASFDLAEGERETSIMSKFIARDELDAQGPVLSAAENNKRLEGFNSDRPMTAVRAQFEYDMKKEREEKEAIVAAAADSFFGGTVVPFVAGAASASLDPVGVAVGAFTGWGLGKVAQRQISKSVISATGGKGLSALEKNVFQKSITSGVKLSPVEKKVLKEITEKTSVKGAKKFALDVFDNMIGNSAAEALVWKDKDQSMEQYTVEDFLQNAVMGSILVTGAVHAGSKSLKVLKNLGDTQLKETQNFVDTLIDQQKSLDVVDEAISIIDRVHEHNETTLATIEKNFGGKVEAGENMAETMKNVKKAHEDGVINDAELESFVNDVKESAEIDSRVLDATEDAPFKYTDKEQQDLKTIMDKSEISPATKISEGMEGYDPVARDQEIAAEVDNIFESNEVDAEGNVIEMELDPELKKIKDEMDVDMKIIEAQEAYLKCRVG